MKGFHYSGTGGGFSARQVFAQLDLPPGKYIVFAKAHIAIGSNAVNPAIRAYSATLEAGNTVDEVIGSLKYDTDDPGSRYESIALNVAVDSPEKPVQARLVMFYGGAGRLYAWRPRLSAIQLEELEITIESKELHDSEHQDWAADLLVSSALSGIPMEATTKILGY